jgi:hypothetical protein
VICCPYKNPIPDNQKVWERCRPGGEQVQVTPTPPPGWYARSRSACSTDCHAPTPHVTPQRPLALRRCATVATPVDGSRLLRQIQPPAAGLAQGLAARSQRLQRGSVRSAPAAMGSRQGTGSMGLVSWLAWGQVVLAGVGSIRPRYGPYAKKTGLLGGRPASGFPDRGSRPLPCGDAAGKRRHQDRPPMQSRAYRLTSVQAD